MFQKFTCKINNDNNGSYLSSFLLPFFFTLRCVLSKEIEY